MASMESSSTHPSVILTVGDDSRSATVKFSGSYIIGILPHERRSRQPLRITLSCTADQACNWSALRPVALQLHQLLEKEQFELIEHFMGRALTLLADHNLKQALLTTCSLATDEAELTQGVEPMPSEPMQGEPWQLELSVAKPAALGFMATPHVRARLMLT